MAASAPEACEDCAQGYVWSGEATGSETTLDGISAYYSAPANAETKAVILFLHDAFGWKFPNNRLLCDKLAKQTGFHVYMPDFYGGETPLTEEQAQVIYDTKPTFAEKIVQGLQVVVMLPAFILHIRKFGAERTQPLLDKSVEEVRKKHGGEECKVGAVGYCWGGKYNLRLGAQGKVAASVACHPSLINMEEDKLKDTKCPTLFLVAEKDDMLPDALWNEIEAAMKTAGVTLDKVVYPGTKHGFAIRCNEADVTALKARDDAFKRTAEWFSKYLA